MSIRTYEITSPNYEFRGAKKLDNTMVLISFAEPGDDEVDTTTIGVDGDEVGIESFETSEDKHTLVIRILFEGSSDKTEVKCSLLDLLLGSANPNIPDERNTQEKLTQLLASEEFARMLAESGCDKLDGDIVL